MKSYISATLIAATAEFGRKFWARISRRKLTLLAVALGGLWVADNGQIADAATMILSGSFVVNDVPEILTCCGGPPTGNQFSSVSGNFSLTYNASVSAPTFSPAPVISLDSFEISFGNALTGPKEFGLFDGVVALINQSPDFANFVIQSNTPPSPGQEGFFLEIFSASGMVLPAPLFEYTQAGNSSTYYVGGSADIADLPVISAAVPEPSTWALLALGFVGLCFAKLFSYVGEQDSGIRLDSVSSGFACLAKAEDTERPSISSSPFSGSTSSL
jgi:hypothetical protein